MISMLARRTAAQNTAGLFSKRSIFKGPLVLRAFGAQAPYSKASFSSAIVSPRSRESPSLNLWLSQPQHPIRDFPWNLRFTTMREIGGTRLLRLQCPHPRTVRRKAEVHPSQPSRKETRGKTRRLAMEQLPPLRHGGDRPSRNRIRMDLEPPRTGYFPTHAQRTRMNGPPVRRF